MIVLKPLPVPIVLSDLYLISTSKNTIEPINNESQEEITIISSSGAQESSLPLPITADISTKALNESQIKDINGQQEKYTNLKPLQESHTSKRSRRPTRIGDCRSEHFLSPRRAKLCFDLAVRKLSEHRERLITCRQQMQKLKLKVRTFENLIRKLQYKQILSKDAAEILLEYLKF